MIKGRSRLLWAVFTLGVVVVGLGSRSSWARPLPDWVTAYAGDILWALLVFLLLGFLFPDRPSKHIDWGAIVVAFGVEFSQLCQAEFLISLRTSRLGSLILGHGFLASDLVCYTFGILLGWGCEFLGSRHLSQRATSRGAPFKPPRH